MAANRKDAAHALAEREDPAFLDAVPNERRRADGHALRALFERITGAPATMWGPSIVGFGTTTYTNTTGTLFLSHIAEVIIRLLPRLEVRESTGGRSPG